MKKILLLFFFIFLNNCKNIENNNDHVITQKINIWHESFGSPLNPAILLIGGAGAQAILWPEDFCSHLADKGYFVIRYDHRDTGKSSEINYFKNPYTIMDLAKDSVQILDYYKIDKAHIVGFSMGGQIAQFLSAYYPERVLTLTLMSTSSSFKEAFNGIFGRGKREILSLPKKEYTNWIVKKFFWRPKNFDEKIKDFIDSWKLLNGDKLPFNENEYRKIAYMNFKRSRLDNPYINHSYAIISSFEMHQKALNFLNHPSLIIHGTEDPIFGIDHANSLNKIIKGSKMFVINGMGHSLNDNLYNYIIELITGHIKNYNYN